MSRVNRNWYNLSFHLASVPISRCEISRLHGGEGTSHRFLGCCVAVWWLDTKISVDRPRKRQHSPPKRRCPTSSLHSVFPWRFKASWSETLVSYNMIIYVFTLNMEAAKSSEKLVSYHITTRCLHLEDGSSKVLRNAGNLPHKYKTSQHKDHGSENLKCIVIIVVLIVTNVKWNVPSTCLCYECLYVTIWLASSHVIWTLSSSSSSSSSSFSFFLMPFLRSRIFLFFNYGSFRHLVGLLGRGISPAPNEHCQFQILFRFESQEKMIAYSWMESHILQHYNSSFRLEVVKLQVQTEYMPDAVPLCQLARKHPLKFLQIKNRFIAATLDPRNVCDNTKTKSTYFQKINCRVQNCSGAHPASYPMGTRGSFLGGKVAGAWNWPLTSI
jgi:hypothetical protein